MLDSMIQMQLHMQAAQKEKMQEKTECSGKGTKTEQEDFWERMERIRKRNREREEMLAERTRRQELRKKRQQEHEEQLMLRRKRQQALDKQYMMKKVSERKLNEKRGAMLMLARSADGRLPVSAEIKRS